MSTKLQKFVILGGYGQIGSCLTKQLSKLGHEVTCLGRGECTAGNEREAYISGVLTEADVVVHAAGSRDQSFAEQCAVHVELSKWVLPLCIDHKVKQFIYLSSVRALTGYSSKKPVTHHEVASPHGHYGMAKLQAERWLLEQKEKFVRHQLRVQILRLPMVYGPGMTSNLDQLISLLNKKVPIPVSYHNRRSLLLNLNLAEFVNKLTQVESTQSVFHVQDGPAISTGELITGLSSASGKKGITVPIPIRLRGVLLAQPLGKSLWERMLGCLEMSTEPCFQLAEYSPSYTTKQGLELTYGIQVR